MVRYFHALSFGVAGLCWVGHAAADSSAGAIAQALYDQGKKLMAAGAFSEACPKLQESQRLDPGGGTILLLARCHAKEGKTATAWVEYQEAQRTAVRDNRKEREKIAREEGAALEARLSRLIIEVPKTAVAPGLTIRRDGIEVGTAQWSLAVAVDPGRHQIVAAAPGRVTWTKTIDVPADRGVITLTVEPLPVAKSELAVAPAPPRPTLDPRVVDQTTAGEERTGTGTALRVTGGVIAGAGIVTIGVGTFFGFKAKAANDQSDQRGCHGTDCVGEESHSLRLEAIEHANLATILYGAGAAAIVAGTTLWLVAPKNESPSIAVSAGPGQMTVRGAW